MDASPGGSAATSAAKLLALSRVMNQVMLTYPILRCFEWLTSAAVNQLSGGAVMRLISDIPMARRWAMLCRASCSWRPHCGCWACP